VLVTTSPRSPPLGAGWRYMIVEVALIAAIFVPVAGSPPVRAFLRDLPRAAQFGLVLFFGLVIYGHLADSSYRTFPFVVWWMYGVEKAPHVVQYERYTGLTSTGHEELLVPQRLFPSLGQNRIAVALRDAVHHIDSSSRDRERAEALLLSLGRAYNRTTPANLVQTVIATQCGVPAEAWHPSVTLSCREVLRVQIPLHWSS
jgi:hypothetical protein